MPLWPVRDSGDLLQAIHDEVLARLLDLNQQRHQQEIIGGSKAKPKSKPKGSSRNTKQAEIPGLD